MTGIALGCVGHLCPSWGLGHSDRRGEDIADIVWGDTKSVEEVHSWDRELSGVLEFSSVSELAYLFFWWDLHLSRGYPLELGVGTRQWIWGVWRDGGRLCMQELTKRESSMCWWPTCSSGGSDLHLNRGSPLELEVGTWQQEWRVGRKEVTVNRVCVSQIKAAGEFHRQEYLFFWMALKGILKLNNRSI